MDIEIFYHAAARFAADLIRKLGIGPDIEEYRFIAG